MIAAPRPCAASPVGGADRGRVASRAATGRRDFTPVAYIGGPPLVWVVPPSSELHSVADLIAAAKADKLSGYASSGVGTVGHLATELFATQVGVKLNHVPYKTTGFALNALFTGEVQAAFLHPTFEIALRNFVRRMQQH